MHTLYRLMQYQDPLIPTTLPAVKPIPDSRRTLVVLVLVGLVAIIFLGIVGVHKGAVTNPAISAAPTPTDRLTASSGVTYTLPSGWGYVSVGIPRKNNPVLQMDFFYRTDSYSADQISARATSEPTFSVHPPPGVLALERLPDLSPYVDPLDIAHTIAATPTGSTTVILHQSATSQGYSLLTGQVFFGQIILSGTKRCVMYFAQQDVASQQRIQQLITTLG
jgi:hypothetical protein